MECADEQIPQMRCEKYTASKGLLPSSIFSKPLKSRPSVLASATILLSRTASISINPLMRVTGLMTIFFVLITSFM
jgi:hypothetical protein